MEHHYRSGVSARPTNRATQAHLQRYYTETPLAPSSLAQHHAVLSAALKAAQMQGLVTRNVAALVVGKPRHRSKHERAMQACWTAEEARWFRTIVQAEDAQTAALYSLALDSGARKGELCGLRWADVDLKAGQVTIVQQLLKDSPPPLFGPPKSSMPRTILLAPKTLELLRHHRAQQAQLILANRPMYQDYGLVFARDWLMGRSSQTLRMPLPLNQVGYRRFRRLITQAGSSRSSSMASGTPDAIRCRRETRRLDPTVSPFVSFS